MKASRIIYRLFMIVFTIAITFLGRMIGTKLYQENVRDTAVEMVGVEVVDLIENIRYSIELGKDIHSFYGMDQTLKDELKNLPSISDLYVVDEDYSVLYCTANDPLPDDAETLDNDLIEHGNTFYGAYDIDGEHKLVTVSDISIMRDLKGDAVESMSIFAYTGCAITLVILVILMLTIKDEDKNWKARLILIAVWILIFGVYCSMVNYRSFVGTMSRVEDAVRHFVDHDLDLLEDAGVEMAYVGSIDDYLARYSENIAGIEKIALNRAGNLDFTLSRMAMSGIIFKYILQMLLMVFFMFVALWELRIFVKESSKNQELDRGSEAH